MERRAFLRLSCTACAAIAGIGVVLPSLSGCSPIRVVKSSATDNTIPVPLTEFKDSKLIIVRSMKLPSDILLVKKSETDFVALEMKCTHQEQPLTATTTGLTCSSHGSTFDLDGNVTHDPATQPLKKHFTSIDSGNVVIRLV